MPDPAPGAHRGPARAPAPVPVPGSDRRRLGQAAATGLALTLGSTALLSALVIWHLVRRGRLIRASQPQPRALHDLEHIRGDAQTCDEPSTDRSPVPDPE